MWVTFNRWIINKLEIELQDKSHQGICWWEPFNVDVVQSTPEMAINWWFRSLAKHLSLWNVVCGPKWMPWKPFFWVLSMLVVQSSCFATGLPPCIFYSNYLFMSLQFYSIRGTGAIRLLRVYRFIVQSISWWWCIWNIVDLYIINWQLVDGDWGAPTVVKSCWVRVIPAGRQ